MSADEALTDLVEADSHVGRRMQARLLSADEALTDLVEAPATVTL